MGKEPLTLGDARNNVNAPPVRHPLGRSRRGQRGMVAAKSRRSRPALQKEKPRIGTTTKSIAAGGAPGATTPPARGAARGQKPNERGQGEKPRAGPPAASPPPPRPTPTA